MIMCAYVKLALIRKVRSVNGKDICKKRRRRPELTNAVEMAFDTRAFCFGEEAGHGPGRDVVGV
jgi:hypothetical protein